MKTSAGALFRKLAEQKKAAAENKNTPLDSSESENMKAPSNHQVDISSDYQINDIQNDALASHRAQERSSEVNEEISTVDLHSKRNLPIVRKAAQSEERNCSTSSNNNAAMKMTSVAVANLRQSTDSSKNTAPINNETKTLASILSKKTDSNALSNQSSGTAAPPTEKRNLWDALKKAAVSNPVVPQKEVNNNNPSSNSIASILKQKTDVSASSNITTNQSNTNSALGQRLGSFVQKNNNTSANDNTASNSNSNSLVNMLSGAANPNASSNDLKKPSIQQLFKNILTSHNINIPAAPPGAAKDNNNQAPPQDKQMISKFANAFSQKKNEKPNSAAIFCLASSFITNLKFKSKSEKNERKEYLLNSLKVARLDSKFAHISDRDMDKFADLFLKYEKDKTLRMDLWKLTEALQSLNINNFTDDRLFDLVEEFERQTTGKIDATELQRMTLLNIPKPPPFVDLRIEEPTAGKAPLERLHSHNSFTKTVNGIVGGSPNAGNKSSKSLTLPPSEINNDPEMMKDTIDFSQFLTIISHQKKYDELVYDDETLSAFVALGGKQDKQGEIETSKFKDIVGEFGLNIDIEKLMSEIDDDGNGSIDFNEFSKLLAAGEMEKDSKEDRKKNLNIFQALAQAKKEDESFDDFVSGSDDEESEDD